MVVVVILPSCSKCSDQKCLITDCEISNLNHRRFETSIDNKEESIRGSAVHCSYIATRQRKSRPRESLSRDMKNKDIRNRSNT